jgi:hypothetical protein
MGLVKSLLFDRDELSNLPPHAWDNTFDVDGPFNPNMTWLRSAIQMSRRLPFMVDSSLGTVIPHRRRHTAVSTATPSSTVAHTILERSWSSNSRVWSTMS